MDHQAFAQLLGNYGEFIGAFAVVSTLAYLALQIRQNTNASKASGYRNAKSQLNSINIAVGQSAELAELVDRALYSFDELDPTEKSRVSWIFLSWTNAWETLFEESRDSPGLNELWMAEERTMLVAFRMGGLWQWWRQNQYGGTTAFRDHMEQLMENAS